MVVFDYLFAAIPMLGILIFVHEFGHFIVAKACGVRVLKFSLGFGPAIGFGSHRLRWERGGTEYVIAWIPLGGFVRMLGEMVPGDEGGDSPLIPADAEPHEFLNAKKAWQKIAITFAGPATNLLLPVLIFALMLWAGIPKTTAVVGMVERDSPGAHAGIQVGDRILEVDHQSVRWWQDVRQRIQGHAEGPMTFLLERGPETLEISVGTGSRSALDEFGDVKKLGWVGLDSRRLPALLGIPDRDSEGAVAGLRSGDWVLAVGDQEVEDWRQLAEAYAASSASPNLVLRVRGGVDEDAPTREVSVPALGDLSALGAISATVLISSVQEGMPAATAGLAPGDLILEVDGRAVGSFRTFADTIRSSEGRSLEIAYARAGEVRRVELVPVLRQVAGPFEIDGLEESVYQVGIAHAMASLPGVLGLDQERNPLISLPRAASLTADNVVLLLRGLGRLVTLQADSDQLRGPITIVQIARKSLDMGWQAYLGMMIFISINLGILNLLPIPILDGGQLLIHLIEGVKRSPLSRRTQEFVQQIGFVVLVMVFGLAFWNDLSGQWTKFIEWLSTEL